MEPSLKRRRRTQNVASSTPIDLQSISPCDLIDEFNLSGVILQCDLPLLEHDTPVENIRKCVGCSKLVCDGHLQRGVQFMECMFCRHINVSWSHPSVLSRIVEIENINKNKNFFLDRSNKPKSSSSMVHSSNRTYAPSLTQTYQAINTRREEEQEEEEQEEEEGFLVTTEEEEEEEEDGIDSFQPSNPYIHPQEHFDNSGHMERYGRYRSPSPSPYIPDYSFESSPSPSPIPSPPDRSWISRIPPRNPASLNTPDRNTNTTTIIPSAPRRPVRQNRHRGNTTRDVVIYIRNSSPH